MLDEEKKNSLFRLIGIVLITFITAFLAFYLALEVMLHRLNDPMYNAKRMEKIMQEQQKDFQRFEDRMAANPFEPGMRPMIVNLDKENTYYKVTVDLKALDGDANRVNVSVDDNVLTVSGDLEERKRGNEKIVSFKQSYYLDDELDISKMTKERKGDKLIITIPPKED